MNDKILYQIKSFQKAVMRTFLDDSDNGFNKRCQMNPPTATQHQIMRYIVEHRDEDIYQKDLEHVLNLRRATVSGVLQTMEKHDLIKRITDDKDTRIKKIILNDESKKVFEDGEKKIQKLESIAVDGISHEDLVTFSQVINKMKENIIKNNIKKG